MADVKETLAEIIKGYIRNLHDDISVAMSDLDDLHSVEDLDVQDAYCLAGLENDEEAFERATTALGRLLCAIAYSLEGLRNADITLSKLIALVHLVEDTQEAENGDD